jgi:hypothetical protein
MLVGLMPHISEGLKMALETGADKLGDVPTLDASLHGPLGRDRGTSFALVFRSPEACDAYKRDQSRIQVDGKSFDPVQDLSDALGKPVMLMIECLP